MTQRIAAKLANPSSLEDAGRDRFKPNAVYMLRIFKPKQSVQMNKYALVKFS